MKSRFIVLTAVLLAASVLSLKAIAGPRVGNGGGSWICKDKASQQYRWIRLVDLFEAEAEFGLNLQDTTGLTYWQIIDQRVAEVQSSVPELQSLLTRTPDQIKEILRMVPDSSSLSKFDDGHIRIHPNPENCENGYIFYGQLANFTDDGRLLVDGGLWQSLAFNEIDRAALLIHEVIYKSLRDSRGDTNSSRSRQIVGILFSNLASKTKSQMIAAVLASPAPKDDNSDVILDPFELTCKAAVTTAAGVYTSQSFKMPITAGQQVSTSIGTYDFTVSADLQTGLPSSLVIFDHNSHSGTNLDKDTIQAVITRKHEVGITLDNRVTQDSALLSCHIEIFPQN